MKKFLTLLSVLILCSVLGGCAKSDAVSQDSLPAPPPKAVEENGDAQDTLLMIKDVSQMLPTCAQLVSYLAISGVPIDMQAPSADDFWLILSMVTYAAKPDAVGEFGTIDLKEDVVNDIASTFFSEMLENSTLPSPNGTYSAAYIGAEDLYELQPISISGMTARLASLEQVNSAEGRYLMTIKLEDEQQRTEKVDWQVYLDDWPDGEEHFFPYQFIKAVSVN